jgi:hypothetical protein
VSVGRCIHARAYVLLRCVFDCLSHGGPQDTGFSALFFAIGKRGEVTCPRLLVSTWVTLHPCLRRVAFLMGHRPFTAQRNGELSIMLSSGSHPSYEPAPATSVSHIQQLVLSDSLIFCYSWCTNVSPEANHSLLKVV